MDFMIMDVRQEGSKHPPTCIINIYNQVEQGVSQDPMFTTDRLANVHFHPEIPMIITGDWNLHHNLWNSTIDTESTTMRMQEVVDWLEGQGFSLCSKKDVHTHSSSGTQWDTVIDLTFANDPASGQGIVQNHIVNPDLAALSDHHALTFTLGDPRESMDNITKAKYNWKDAKEEDFIEALNQILQEDDSLIKSSIQQVLNNNCTHASPVKLDNVVRVINNCMECAAEKVIPTHCMCSQSKPWWNNALLVAFKDMRTARDMACSYYQHFNHQSKLMILEAQKSHKRALNL